MTISQLADLIIIGAFFAVLGGVVGDTIGRFITWLIDRREARRKGKENEE